jgi:hypothetical protein
MTTLRIIRLDLRIIRLELKTLWTYIRMCKEQKLEMLNQINKEY